MTTELILIDRSRSTRQIPARFLTFEKVSHLILCKLAEGPSSKWVLTGFRIDEDNHRINDGNRRDPSFRKPCNVSAALRSLLLNNQSSDKSGGVLCLGTEATPDDVQSICPQYPVTARPWLSSMHLNSTPHLRGLGRKCFSNLRPLQRFHLLGPRVAG